MEPNNSALHTKKSTPRFIDTQDTLKS